VWLNNALKLSRFQTESSNQINNQCIISNQQSAIEIYFGVLLQWQLYIILYLHVLVVNSELCRFPMPFEYYNLNKTKSDNNNFLY
jgi:hypothetical protein